MLAIADDVVTAGFAFDPTRGINCAYVLAIGAKLQSLQ